MKQTTHGPTADYESPLLDPTEKKKKKLGTLMFPFLPWWKKINRADVLKDLLAGVTVGVLLIPQSMSYAALAHLPPQYGLYTGFIPLIVFAFTTSSYHISVGPVAPVCVLIGNALIKIVGSDSIDPITEYGNEEFQSAASGLALVAGIILLVMAILRLGFIVKYLSVPVMTGFVTGAAFIIFGNQLKAFFGLHCDKTSYFYTTLYNSLAAMDTISWKTTLLSMVSFLFLAGCKFCNVPRWFPAPFILMLVTTILSYVLDFQNMGIQIVGDLPSGIPTPKVPKIIVPHLMVMEGFIVALVAYVGSLGLAKSLARDSPLDYEINANLELVAYGMASVCGSFFLAFPPSGSFSRSALCFEMEGQTPLHGIFTACVMCIALYVTEAFKYLPKCVLSAIILMSVRRLFLNGWKEMVFLVKARSTDVVECFMCICAVCFLGITDGIAIGAVLSLVNYVYMTSFAEVSTRDNQLTVLNYGHNDRQSAVSRGLVQSMPSAPPLLIESNTTENLCNKQMGEKSFSISLPTKKKVKVIYPKAGIFYANVMEVADSVKLAVKDPPEILELNLHYSPFLDSTSARMLLDCLADASKTVSDMVLSNCSDHVTLDLQRYARSDSHKVVLQSVKIFNVQYENL